MSEQNKELIFDDMSQKIIDTAESLVTLYGVHTISVRRILQTLGISNRVFYNRFHNIDEVLSIVYKNTVMKIRESMPVDYNNSQDFFEYVADVLTSTLLVSYEAKMKFNHYVFENDSVSKSNYDWWTTEIKKLIDYAMEKGYIKEVDSAVLSYSIWCFCRGYNADAVSRNLPKEEAVKNFRYSFGFLLEGLKK